MYNEDSCLMCILRWILRILVVFTVIMAAMAIWASYITKSDQVVDGQIVQSMEYLGKADISEISERRMYLQLNEQEQLIYRAAKAAVENSESSFEMKVIGYTREEANDFLDQAMSALYYDYPEFFWWNKEYSFHCEYSLSSKKTLDSKFTLIYPEYWITLTEKETYSQELMVKARILASQAKKQETLYEQVKFVHDYLVKNVMKGSMKYGVKPTIEELQLDSAYGPLINHQATSKGYAKAFQLVMSMMGIECLYAEGEGSTAGRAWNCVQLDDEYYWIDVFHNDYNLKDFPNLVVYDYFCCSSAELTAAHYELADTFEFPECNATEYNYFHKEGFYIEEFDYDLVCQMLERERGKEMISFKFSNEDEVVKFASVMIHDEQRLKQLPYYKEKKCIFNTNPYINIISITVSENIE